MSEHSLRYIDNDSFFTRIDALSKLIWVILVILTTFQLTSNLSRVVMLAVGGFIAWWAATGDPARGLQVMISVLVVSCPCALGVALPVAVLDFFASDWQRVLQLLYLRKGTDSAEWSDAVSLMEDLVRSVAAPPNALARGALARGLAQLYQRLEAALALTQSHTEDAQARVDVIRDVHRKLLAQPVQDPATVVEPIERARIHPRNQASATPTIPYGTP